VTDVKQKICMTFTIIFLAVFALYTNSSGEEKTNAPIHEIDEIIRIMDKNDITVDSWSINAREAWGSLSQEQLQNQLEQLQNIDDRVQWEIKEKQGMWKAVGTLTHPNAITEEIIVVGDPQKDHFDTYLLYRVNGSDWKQNTQEYYAALSRQRVNDFFDDAPKNFACVNGKYNANIEGVLYQRTNNLLKDFSAEEIESLKEESFVSLSAYTEKWKNDIPTKNGTMNLQIALREGLGGATTVAIGTPIITSEY
jgi:hypothetical protein